MCIEKQRVLSLLEFAQQSARLRSRPASNINQHGQFTLHEHQIHGLPGIRLNVQDTAGEEVWMVVDRLHQTKPPEIEDLQLKPWVNLTQGPDTEPTLRSAINGADLIAAG